MEHLKNARTVRLRSSHGKYLYAEDDMVSVSQDRDSGELSMWRVELIDEVAVRFKSCFDGYLTATEVPFLLGMTGRKVSQTRSHHQPDSCLEWEPVPDKDKSLYKLRTRHGNYLRANGGLPPWRNSVTHDVPVRTATQNWVLWDIEIVEQLSEVQQQQQQQQQQPQQQQQQQQQQKHDHSHHQLDEECATPSIEAKLSFKIPKSEGRLIWYVMASGEDNDNKLPDEEKWSEFYFKGHTVPELTQQLRDQLNIDESIIVCTRHPHTGQLYPLQLGLPPNNSPMHLVALKASSPAAKRFHPHNVPL